MVFDPVTAAALGYGGYRLLRGLFKGADAPLVRPSAPAPVAVPPALPAPFPYPLFTPDRGAHRTTHAEARRYMCADAGPMFELANMWLPAREYLNKLTLVTGRPGAGKTTLLKLMLKSLANLFPLLPAQARLGLYPGEGNLRLFLPDPTNAYLGYLYQILPLDVPIIRASPHDLAGRRWDIARDVTNDAENVAFQTALFPAALVQKSGDPFWITKGQAVTESVITAYHDLRSNWEFHDLIIPIKYPQFLKPLLMQCGRTRGVVKHDLVGRLGRDIVSTCSATINKMAVAAAMWQRAEATFSVSEFLEQRAVLHFGFAPDMVPALGGIANALMSTLVLHAIRRNEEFSHTYLLGDEANYLADVSSLDQLAARGRGAGLGAILLPQSIPGLIAKWGQFRVDELMELLACWITLGAGQKTATAFTQLVGDVEGLAESYGDSYTSGISTSHSSSYGGSNAPGPFGRSTGTNWNYSSSSTYSSSTTHSKSFQLVTKPAILPSEITNLPNADPRTNTISGFMFTPGVGAWEFTADFIQYFQGLPPAPFPTMPTRPPADQVLTPWTVGDLKRLRLEPTDEMMKAIHLTWGKRGGP